MDIFRYEVFLNAVECGSFSRVAAQLGYTQSGVSHMMKCLENEMGFPLFLRTKDGVSLTEEGERIISSVRALVNSNRQMEEKLSDITGLKNGMLRIGAYTSITTMILLPILRQFHKDFSHIHYDIVEGTTSDLARKLSENQIDIGFFSKQSFTDQFKYFPILEDEYLAIVNKNSEITKNRYFHWSAVKQHHLIIPNINGECEAVQIVRKQGISFDDTYSTNDTYATITMVEQNMGISIIPQLVLKSHYNNVVALSLEVPEYRTLGMFTPTSIALSPLAKKFVDYCKKMIPSIIANINTNDTTIHSR